MKSILKLFLIIILIFCYNITFADSNESLFKFANEHYTKGEFEKAIELYEQILNSEVESSEIYFNLGNAYYKSNKTTMAILNYERAKKLAPNDEDILSNLELAQKHVIDKIEVLPELFIKKWIWAFENSLSSDTWAIYSVIGFIIFLIFFLLFLFSNKIIIKKISFVIGLLLFVFSVVGFKTSYKLKKNSINIKEAIIVSPAVTVKSSPDESGTDLFLLHEGLKVNLTDSLGEWRKIKLSDGNVGWLEKTAIIPI